MISIIIPVYNTAKYLDQCLESVIAQSYTDWECIVVDDGSTDNSGELCDNWGERDNRFVIIHQKNQGVSAARNHGLEKSKGEFICFIDSDDWVEPDYLVDMISGFADEAIDMVVTGIIHEKTCPESFVPKEESAIILSKDCVTSFIDNVGLLYGPTAILYKAWIIREREIKFPEDISFGEDTIFNFNYLRKVNTILFRPIINYHYRILNDSLSSNDNSNRSFLRYNLWKERKAFYIEKEMWNQISQTNMYRELWAIIYDGIFSVKTPSLHYLQELMKIREISELKGWTHIFNAPAWVKYGILRRMYKFFFLVRRIK